MPDSSLHTTVLHDLLDRIRAGDQPARDELLRRVCDRLEQLARKMLRRFPRVQRWTETTDVLQNALMRLDRSLKEVRPDSMRSFFNFAAVLIRRELIDLARRVADPHGQARPAERDAPAGPREVTDRVEDPEDQERWSAFHEHVERLPAEEREVLSLAFYHGWTQAQIAELFGVDARTVRRRYAAACGRLGEMLGGRFPEVSD